MDLKCCIYGQRALSVLDMVSVMNGISSIAWLSRNRDMVLKTNNLATVRHAWLSAESLLIVWPLIITSSKVLSVAGMALVWELIASVPLRWLKAVSSTFQDIDFDVSLLPLVFTWCYNHGIKKLPNHRWTRWYHFRDTVGYHSNTITC